MKRNWFTPLMALICALSLFNIEIKSEEIIRPYDISGDWGGQVEPFTQIEFPDGRKIAWRDYTTRIIEEPCDVVYMTGGGHPRVPHNPKREVKISLRDITSTKPEQMFCAVFFGNRRRVLLQYPPAGTVWHAPGGVTQLTSVLRKEGHEVRQRWGHIIGLEHVLLSQNGPDVLWALSAIRNRGSTIKELARARTVLEQASERVQTLDKFRYERNNVLYGSEHQDGTIRGVLTAIAQQDSHLWHDYFQTVEVPVAREFNPHVYGISVGDERQLMPGFVLASLIKEHVPDCIVVVGGNFFGRIPHPDDFLEFGKLFDHVDAIVYAEGYQPLMTIAETLDVSQASGTIWRDGTRVVVNQRTDSPTEFSQLSAPALDGDAVQWAPETVPTLYTQSHCPQACEFCAIAAQSDTFASGRLDNAPKIKPRSMTVRQIADFMRETGAHKFDITDELFPIARQLRLGEELRRINYDATWQCYLTVTDNLRNPQVAHDLYDAGCRSVQLGLETLSKETLLQIHKQWNTPASYDRILQNFRDASIHTHVFLMIGLPGEPLSEGLKWVGFLEKHGRNILTIKSGRWRPARYAPEVEKGLLDTHVEIYPDDKPFQANRSFRYRDPLHSNTKVDAMRDIVEQACRRHWAYAVTSTIPWWVNRSRYSWDELEQMARALPPEADVPHIDQRLAQMRTLVRKELDREANFRTWEEFVEFTTTLL